MADATRFGPLLLPDGGVRFRLYAPAAAAVNLECRTPEHGTALRRPMEPQGDGWHALDVPEARAGTRYRFEPGTPRPVPDPASRFQPEGVHGWSEVIDLAGWRWRTPHWRGRSWNEAVIYELHVGCFTPEGRFDAIERRLAALRDLGVTAIQLMPVAAFAGQRGWGYDGVLPFAPFAGYGRPADLQRLVDAAHALGLMVLLDVVYNHFGADGNYLPSYWPAVMNPAYETPWGAAVNLDGEGSREVRHYFTENALQWLRDYRFDGLRLDAVHELRDSGTPTFLQQLATTLRDALPGRELHLVLENEDNDADLLQRRPDGHPRWYTAQWNDDVHHGLHVRVTGEREGYYAPYAADPALLGRALAEGFAFQGEWMPYRDAPRGKPSAQLPPQAFVAFLQNHDQVGNRAFGERIAALAGEPAVRAALSVLLLGPQVPLLFMGEEHDHREPFLYFSDLGEALRAAVRDGRRREFARFAAFRDPAARERIPDATAPATFDASRLDPARRDGATGRSRHDWVQRALDVRRREVLPWLDLPGACSTIHEVDSDRVSVSWSKAGCVLALEANLGSGDRVCPPPAGRVFFSEGDAAANRLGPWAVRWSRADA